MRIVHIGHHDTAGSAFFLAHAINKHTKHQAVNIRFLNDYLRWPVMVQGSSYTKEDIRKMLYKADVIHFHIRVRPFFVTLQLDPQKIREKKTLVYYHGSMLRIYGEQLQPHALEYLPDHVATVSTPDLLQYLEKGVEGHWLPIVRPFKEIAGRYGRSKQDKAAMWAFGSKKIVTFGHATTSVAKKGSRIFFNALTEVVRGDAQVRASMIVNNPWDACIRKTSEFDVALGNANVFKIQKKGEPAVVHGTGYGLVSVEAGIFKIPCINMFTSDDEARYKQVAGEAPPLVSWSTKEDLVSKMIYLAQKPDERKRIGGLLHNYMVKFHDEKPVVDRYLELISEL